MKSTAQKRRELQKSARQIDPVYTPEQIRNADPLDDVAADLIGRGHSGLAFRLAEITSDIRNGFRGAVDSLREFMDDCPDDKAAMQIFPVWLRLRNL